MNTPRNRLAEFWALVDKSAGPDGCWPFMGARNAKGYGMFRMNGAPQYAHRIAFSTEYGQLPSGRQACHTCDNPPCSNPKHLFAGTASMNLRDAYNKRRRRGAPPVKRGEDHHKARLTEGKVREIRKLAATGVGQDTLAEAFGVNQSTIQRVISRKAWAHVA